MSRSGGLEIPLTMHKPFLTVGALCALLVSGSLLAQVVNPADKQKPPGESPQQGEPLVVEGRSVSELLEENRIGSYGQPEWTKHRRFSETRVYVRPEGTAEFEYWLVPEIPASGSTEVESQLEFEFGLPHRFQLDLYLVGHQEGNEGGYAIDEQKVEVRWAFADWDVIWGNPTAYLEWVGRDEEADKVEAKLLFGGEIDTGWHWGTNLVFEHEMGGLQANGYEVTGGVSYTLIDQKLSAGAEAKLAFEDDKLDRGSYSNEFLLGPSFQFRPVPRSHIDFAALAGLTDDSPDAKFIVVFGWEF